DDIVGVVCSGPPAHQTGGRQSTRRGGGSEVCRDVFVARHHDTQRIVCTAGVARPTAQDPTRRGNGGQSHRLIVCVTQLVWILEHDPRAGNGDGQVQFDLISTDVAAVATRSVWENRIIGRA